MLTLKDKLSHLTYRQARRHLGERGEVEKNALALQRKKRIAAAGGELLGAAFAFLSERVPGREDAPENNRLAGIFRMQLSQCMEKDEDGSLRMSITLPAEAVLNNLAKSRTRLAGA